MTSSQLDVLRAKAERLYKSITAVIYNEELSYTMDQLHEMARNAEIRFETATYIFDRLNADPLKYSLRHASCTALVDKIHRVQADIRSEQTRLWQEGQSKVSEFEKSEFDDFFFENTGIDLTE